MTGAGCEIAEDFSAFQKKITLDALDDEDVQRKILDIVMSCPNIKKEI